MHNERPDTDTSEILQASDVPDSYGDTLSSEQAAAILGHSAQKARKLAREGKLPARLINDKRGLAWRFERVGLLAPKPLEDPMAMIGAMMTGRDVAEIVRIWAEERQEDRRTIKALNEENARVREELAAERARAELAMKMLASPPMSEPPKRRPWWRRWV